MMKGTKNQHYLLILFFVNTLSINLFATQTVMELCHKSNTNSRKIVAIFSNYRFMELLNFEVRLGKNNRVELNWSTASEKGSYYFEVEKSLDGAKWESVVTIDAAKNSSFKKSYLCYDEHPYNETTYYRLKQVDLNGRYTHSPVITLNLENELDASIDLYPNPASSEITIQGPAKELQNITVYDVTGREQNLNGCIEFVNPYKVILNLTLWKEGVYIFKTASNIKKFIKID